MKITAFVVVVVAFLLFSVAVSVHDLEAELRATSKTRNRGSGNTGGNIPGAGGSIPNIPDPGSFFGPGGQFNFPGMGGNWGNMGGGYGAGYSGPGGGYARGGVVRPSVVCSERGPCYKKRLTCPAKCFTSYARSGKGYGAGGGGGGCTIDCKKNCVAYC